MLSHFSRRLWQLLRFRLACDIKGELPSSTRLPHPVGIVISKHADIGPGCDIYQNVTIGTTIGAEYGYPIIGKNTVIYAGATVINSVQVGHDCTIAAGAVVVQDIPPETTVAGVPAKPVE